MIADAASASLARDGFGLLPKVLDREMLGSVRRMSENRLAAEPREHFDRFLYHGSMLPLDWRDPAARRLVTWPATRAGLAKLGFTHPKWLSGYVISKPPHAPPLWWHQDWWAWDEPTSFNQRPPQLFIMYYLTDVAESNGCLRVIPGSHRRRHQLHDALPEAHSREINDSEISHRAHACVDDEVSVPVKAGDAVVGDVRLLHATHPNDSDEPRTCITLWYLPTYDELPDPLKAYVVRHPFLPPAGWWRGDSTTPVPGELAPYLPTYEGDAEPAHYNRTPPPLWTS